MTTHKKRSSAELAAHHEAQAKRHRILAAGAIDPRIGELRRLGEALIRCHEMKECNDDDEVLLLAAGFLRAWAMELVDAALAEQETESE